jgi:hypothetical protein
MRGIFGPKGEGVAGMWRRLNNEELHNLYTSPNTIIAIKPRMIWMVMYHTRFTYIKNYGWKT